jgi:hypothetical protein
VDVRQALAGDLHDILGFKVVPGAQDLGAVTLGQSEKGVALADIFKGKQGTGTKANVDTSKAAMAKASEPANSEDLAEARRRVNTENKNVWARTQHLLNLEDSARQAGEGVALAIRNVELQKRKLVASNLAWELYKLNQQKIAIAEDIETASKLIAVGLNVGLATLDPHEALELGIDAALELGTVCVNTYYREHMEEKIKKLDDAVKGANLQINAEEFELVGYGAVQEAQKKSVTVKEVQLAKEDLTIALGRAQSAYTDFAKLAGQFAGGSPQNRELVESAIIAIPKVEYLVGTIATVILLIGEPPTYSEIAGIGYRANLAVAGESFSVHYPLLKGYQRKFYNEYTLWTERLESLKAVANAFAPAPSGGPELTPPVQIPQVGDFPESLPGEQPNLKYG